MTGVPTPGTLERQAYDVARAYVLSRPDSVDITATSYLDTIVELGATDAAIAATVRGVLAGIRDVMAAAMRADDPERVESVALTPDGLAVNP